MNPCSRNVYEVTYVVKQPKPGGGVREQRSSVRVLADNALQAANAVADDFPGWWTALPDCQDTITVEGVQGIVHDIRFEVPG